MPPNRSSLSLPTKEITILASAAAVADRESATIENPGYRGAIFSLHVTAAPGNSETLRFNIAYICPVDSSFDYNATPVDFTVFTGTDTVDRHKFVVMYPGAVETDARGNIYTQGLPLPRRFRVKVIHSGAGSWTYTVGCTFIP